MRTNAPLCHLVDQTKPIGLTQRRQDARGIDILQGQSVSKVQSAQNFELNHLHCHRGGNQ